MKVAVVGATGIVGRMMLNILDERKITIKTLLPVASEHSNGKIFCFNGKNYHIIGIEQAIYSKPDIAFFTAGKAVSNKWAPQFARIGTTVIDNSSAWRMDPNKKLIIPEINSNILSRKDKIIANPNCSTIQLVMVIAPLHKHYGIKRLIISTYQSVTGAGYRAVNQLKKEQDGEYAEMIYPHPIHQNALPHCDVFQDNGYTNEEVKLIQEPKKILNDNNIAITATAVRIPVVGGHSESVNVILNKMFNLSTLSKSFSKNNGVIVQDNPYKNIYPMPLSSYGKDEVFVGRLRRDFSNYNSLHLWIVADNLRKGAATNAIQIAEVLIKERCLNY